MHYTAAGKSNRHIELVNERQEPVGSLDYISWFPNKAQISTKDNNVYELAPAGFWRSAITIKRNGVDYAELKPNWLSSLILSFENGRAYTFKKKSIWSSDHVLVDDEQREIAKVKVIYKWSTWSFKYEIDVHENNLDKDANVVLPFLLIYYAKYIRMRQAAAT